MRWLTIGLALAFAGLTAFAARPQPAEAQVGCEFILGFKTVHDMIPDTVGACTTNEYHNPYNGDGLQLTTRGLLVWRKIDNWTAFTDGFTTWINGPFGLQARLNTETFAWEPITAPVAFVPPPAPVVVQIQPPQPAVTTAASATATNNPPSITLDLSDDRVNKGETFSIRLQATDDSGIDGMWWWATSTSDSDLRDTHTFDCHGANPCRQTWEVSTDDTGTITIHAMSRDTSGATSSEAATDVRVRS